MRGHRISTARRLAVRTGVPPYGRESRRTAASPAVRPRVPPYGRESRRTAMNRVVRLLPLPPPAPDP
ncbi:hypothetical protein [Streptomyces bottropensis]|uniref:hypothetical protein n=1 Tax=Streptomyces bottropensis TaxID=42235 RepID=UPI0036B0DA1B